MSRTPIYGCIDVTEVAFGNETPEVVGWLRCVGANTSAQEV